MLLERPGAAARLFIDTLLSATSGSAAARTQAERMLDALAGSALSLKPAPYCERAACARSIKLMMPSFAVCCKDPDDLEWVEDRWSRMSESLESEY